MNMVSVEAAELSGAALDWAVAKCEKVKVRWSAPHEQLLLEGYPYLVWSPHKDGGQGHPILEREKIGLSWAYPRRSSDPELRAVAEYFQAPHSALETHRQFGPTLLIAAMRCYVASRLGDTVEIPEDIPL